MQIIHQMSLFKFNNRVKIKLIPIVVLISFLSFCSKDESSNVDYFAFGTAYGECFGNCAKFFLIKDNNLYPDDMYYYFGSSLKFQSKALPVDKYNLAKKIVDDFPEYLKNNLDTTFGCPDCCDQGGIHIEINNNREIEYWHIDMDITNQPAEIRDYIQEVLDILGQLL